MATRLVPVGVRQLWFTFAALLVVSSMVQAIDEVWSEHATRQMVSVDHAAWQQLLDNYLDDAHPSGINRFDYEAVTAEDRAQLDKYLDYLQGLDPRSLTKDQQFAYWVNLYNAKTVDFILGEKRDIDSIREIRSGLFRPGPWQRKDLSVAGHDLSLDDIEHGILRPIWRDKRIHYAVNCASLGCPNLMKTAFTADNVESLLEQAAVDFINHPRGVNIQGGQLTLSRIYSWYAEDFGDNFSELLQHLSDYAQPPLDKQLQDFESARYQYDWDLNRP